MDAAAPQRARTFTLDSSAVMLLGLAALAIPTCVRLADQTWNGDFGAYGPIILVTGAWLLWRQFPRLRAMAVRGSMWISAAVLAAGLASYIFGRAYDFITLEAAGVWVAGVAMLYARFGGKAVAAAWFPLLYLAFVIPPPHTLLLELTAPLKTFVSFVATSGLAHLGLPVAREGVTIFIAQYQLLVEDACSGMNSIVGLIAVSLLYVYLMRGSSWLYSAILAVLVVPIAIFANILRIVALILITYWFGNAVGQSFLHFAAGMFLFALALVSVFALDKIMAGFLLRRRAGVRAA
ncbi:MAG: exosortase V [Caulobacteraceae bacterium]